MALKWQWAGMQTARITLTFTENLGFHNTAPFHLIVTQYFSMFLVANVAVGYREKEGKLQQKNKLYGLVFCFIIVNEAVLFKRHNMKMDGGRIGIAPRILALGGCVGSTAALNAL
jgi:hypothetical protein